MLNIRAAISDWQWKLSWNPRLLLRILSWNMVAKLVLWLTGTEGILWVNFKQVLYNYDPPFFEKVLTENVVGLQL